MPAATPARDKLEKVGIDAICERIESGEAFNEIAKAIGVNRNSLMDWIGADERRLSMSARAREASAEAWLERGRDTIASALLKSGDVDPSAARAYAQECARLAAIRNRHYRDKSELEHSGKIGLSQMSDEELERRARGEN